MTNRNIITVSFNPVWDRTCYVDGLEWGDHKVMASQTCVPAGKALNISKALAWMSVPSMAAGLWGSVDCPDMSESLLKLQEYIQLVFTVVDGQTRQNVTVVDTRNSREMHLRSGETLITPDALMQLRQDLKRCVDQQCAVVFAGSIPQGELQDQCIELVKWVRDYCGELIVDTSGSGLAQIIENCTLDMIKPNLDELSELLGDQVENNIQVMIANTRQLCDRVKTIVVSLGADGAVAVTKESAVHCRVIDIRHRIVNTVGCGDYLLGGYLSADLAADLATKLTAGIKAATVKALGWVETRSWQEIQQNIEVEITQY